MVRKESKTKDEYIDYKEISKSASKELANTEEENIDHINNLIVSDEDMSIEEYDVDTSVHVINDSNELNDKEEKIIVPAQKQTTPKQDNNKIDKTLIKDKVEIKTVVAKEKILAKPINKSIIKPDVKNKNNNNNTTNKDDSNKKKELQNKKEIRYPIKKKTSTTINTVERTKMNKEHKMKKNPKNEKTHHKKTIGIWVWIVLAVVIVAAAAIILIKGNYIKTVNPTTSEIAATVNGEPIYAKDIKDQYNNLNSVMQKIYTEEVLLNQTIDELLLIQQANKLNIKATEAQITAELNMFKLQNQLTDKDLEEILTKQNLTITQLEDLIRKKLVVKQLLNETIFTNITITNEEITTYYNTNKEQFAMPEQVTASHILIMVKDNVTADKALEKILSINKSLTPNNFCELVKANTDDLGSQNTCGTYTFGKGEMVQEFEDASFDLEINKTTIVKSIYGYHLIKKLAYTPAQTQSLDEVKKEIESALRDKKAQENFDNYIISLRNDAKIVNYMIRPVVEEKSVVNTNANEQANNKEPTANTQVTVTENKVETANLDNFAKCLTDKGAKFYGASWCPHCNNQKTLFGESIKYVKYVECAVEGQPQVQTPECEDAKITGYPTWTIDGKQYPGEQSLAQLAKLSGCTI